MAVKSAGNGTPVILSGARNAFVFGCGVAAVLFEWKDCFHTSTQKPVTGDEIFIVSKTNISSRQKRAKSLYFGDMHAAFDTAIANRI